MIALSYLDVIFPGRSEDSQVLDAAIVGEERETQTGPTRDRFSRIIIIIIIIRRGLCYESG